MQAAELGTKETVEYIRSLEGESERLKKLVKDINAQLHASKVITTLSPFSFLPPLD